MEDKKYWIWLSRIKQVKSSKLEKLINQYGTPEIIWELNRSELLKNKYITENDADNLIKKEYKQNLEKYEQYMKQNFIDIIHIKDTDYPQKLRNIYDKPLILYIKGNRSILNDTAIGVIGCRQASEYGKTIAQNMSYNLSKSNINVVSGLAIGIDSYAHIGTLKNKQNSPRGKTIAVIGNGLDDIYPSENKILAKEIIESGGAIISEYIVGTKPEKQNFPARNRIISGLSDGILVIEAKEKSGTLITVDFALEQGKDVYAIPGNINNKNSIGTNKLLKEGAILVTELQDIVNNLKLV